MTNRRNRSKSPPKSAAHLAKEQFPELNATLYNSDPAAYLRFRLHTLITMYNQGSGDPAETDPLKYGSLSTADGFSFSKEEREQAIAIESTMLVHHAAESLLRLYLAHADRPECPWMRVAKLRFPEVKAKAAGFARTGHEWPPGAIEEVFLGGATLESSKVDMSAEEWTESSVAFSELMHRSAERVIEQAPLYNAAKHGLVGVPADIGAWGLAPTGDKATIVASGQGLTYLLQEYPTQAWAAQTDVVDIESDLLIVQLIAIAVHNLWTTARRRFLATADGYIYPLSTHAVDTAFLYGVSQKANIVRGISIRLHEKTDPDAKWGDGIGPAQIRLNMVRVGEDVAESLAKDGSQEIGSGRSLPLRPVDRSVFTGGDRYLFPFSPEWSSAV